jgi:thioredoxin 1
MENCGGLNRVRHTATMNFYLEKFMKLINLQSGFRACLAACLLTVGSWANALEIKPFSQAALSTIQQQGKPVVVHFHADWCSTCVVQAKTLEAMKTDPQFAALTVLVADYDKEKDLRKNLKVRTQSVLVVYKGSQEVSRLVGQTQANEFKAAFLKAL